MVPIVLQFLLLLLTLVSIRYWFLIIKAQGLTPVFELNPERSTSELSPPVLLALLWICYQVVVSLNPPPPAPLELNQIIQSCLILLALTGILLLILTMVSWKSLVQLGFRLDQIPTQLRDGALGFLLALVPVILLLVATHPFRSEETLHPLLQLLRSAPGVVAIGWVFLSAIVVAPLFEELLYRVLLQSWLEGFLSPLRAIIVSSLIFSLVHGFPDSIPLFPLAFLLGTLYYYRRSYIANVFMHALFNAINFALALAGDELPG